MKDTVVNWMAQRRIAYGVQSKLCRAIICSFIISDKGEGGSHLPPPAGYGLV